MKNETKRKRWTDGMSATVCVLVPVVVIPVLVSCGVFVGLSPFLAFGSLLFAMAFFWSALWKFRCRDVWAWIALLIGIAVLMTTSSVRWR